MPNYENNKSLKLKLAFEPIFIRTMPVHPGHVEDLNELPRHVLGSKPAL